MNEWLPWVVGLIGILSAGTWSWPKVKQIIAHLANLPSTKPKASEHHDVVESDAQELRVFTGKRKLTRAEAFLAIDDLQEFFGEMGSTSGVEAARCAGIAMYGNGQEKQTSE